MKYIKHIMLVLISAVTLVSCDINNQPVFNDKDAFVAFRSASVSIGEDKDSVLIPVLLTSLSGIETTVDFEIDTTGIANPAKGDSVNYKILNATQTLHFTKDAPTQYIKLQLIDNNTFDGDVQLKIKLKSPQGVNLGASSVITLTITDNEHPLLFILGDLTAKGVSSFDGDAEWTVTIAKDANDLTKVWIYNLVKDGSSSSSPVYGVVNAEKTEIKIPVSQIIAVNSSYPKILLEGFSDPEGDVKIPTGGFIVGAIAPDGTITIHDWFGSHVYKDDAASVSAGWYNILEPGVTMKKNN